MAVPEDTILPQHTRVLRTQCTPNYIMGLGDLSHQES